jgi:hypothetical protein
MKLSRFTRSLAGTLVRYHSGKSNISIYNSLSKEKVPLLVPQHITWYTWYVDLIQCYRKLTHSGPTVYDFSHLGHARNYVQVWLFVCFFVCVLFVFVIRSLFALRC